MLTLPRCFTISPFFAWNALFLHAFYFLPGKPSVSGDRGSSERGAQLGRKRHGVKERERWKGGERRLKYSMLPLCLLADNYTSRRYKELGRSKLKAPKISRRALVGTPLLCFSGLGTARFSGTATERRAGGRTKRREGGHTGEGKDVSG